LKIKCDGHSKLYYENKYEINITHNLTQHDRTKYIEVDKHFIKEKLDNDMLYTPSQG